MLIVVGQTTPNFQYKYRNIEVFMFVSRTLFIGDCGLLTTYCIEKVDRAFRYFISLFVYKYYNKNTLHYILWIHSEAHMFSGLFVAKLSGVYPVKNNIKHTLLRREQSCKHACLVNTLAL